MKHSMSYVYKCSFLVLLLFTMGAGQAHREHATNNIVSVDVGTQLWVRGTLTGLSSGNVTVILNAVGNAEVDCVNSANEVIKGKKISVSLSGSSTYPSPKNGRMTFAVYTFSPVITSVDSCPDSQWIATVSDVEFTHPGASFIVVQGNKIVFTEAIH